MLGCHRLPELTNWTRFFVIEPLMLADESRSVVTLTVDELLEQTNLKNKAAVRAAWPEVVESPFVERIGSAAAEERGVWVLSLKFPEEAE